MVFDITEEAPRSCNALEESDGKYWCGLIVNPQRYLTDMVGEEQWKLDALAQMVSRVLGIGEGCGMSPSKRELISSMKRLQLCR